MVSIIKVTEDNSLTGEESSNIEVAVVFVGAVLAIYSTIIVSMNLDWDFIIFTKLFPILF